MSAQSLTVRVGLIFDEKSLAGIERSMRNSGQRLSKIGKDLSLSLSLPLAAFGVTAIKAAGDIESLTLALKSQLGTADAAAKELDKLTEAAKNPGLGLEQAVRGSVRLQGVAFSADEARNVLVQMGNAIAATGGSAQELDNVTRQFAQMTSKGRVLQEDVSILSENMPGLAQLMQKAFGTQSVEAIRDMGITGKEFVLQITKAAESLPRVESGIKNGIGNAIDSLKQSAAKMGFAINEAFDITGLIESVSGAVLGLAEAFNSMSPAAKEVALVLAAIVISVGPMLKVYGVLKVFGSQIVGVWGDMVGAGKALVGTSDAMAGALTRVKVAFGIITLVTGLALAVYQLSDNFNAAEYASELYADGQKEIIKQTSQEIGLLNQNFAALKDETKGRFEKGKIVDALIKQYPQYLKGIDLEKASVEQLTQIQKGLNDQILRGVAERQKASAVTAIYEKQAQILIRIQQIRDGADVTAGEASLINTGDMIRAGSIAEAVILKMQGQATELGKQVGVVAGQFDKAFGTLGNTLDPVITKQYEARDAAEAEREAHQQGLTVTKEDTKVRVANSDAIDEQKKRLKLLKEVLSDIKVEADLQDLTKKIDPSELLEKMAKGIERLLDGGFAKTSKEVVDLTEKYKKLNEEIEKNKPKPKPIDTTPIPAKPTAPVVSQSAPTGSKNPPIPKAIEDAKAYAEAIKKIQKDLDDGNKTFAETFQAAIDLVAERGTKLEQIYLAMGNAIQQSAANGETSFEKLGQAAAGAAAKIIRSYIQQGVAAAVAKALGSAIPFPFNIAAGAAAGGLAAALFTRAIGAVGVKGFAQGTNFAPGGMALVGEQGPELINLPRGSKVFPTPQTNQMLSGMGGGGIGLFGEFTVKGTDLALVLERTKRANERFR